MAATQALLVLALKITSGLNPVRPLVETFKCVVNDAFKHTDLAIAEFLVFVGAAFLRQRPIVLPYKQNEIFRKPVRHLDGFHYAAERFVVTAQIVNLSGQVLLDGPHKTQA